MKRALRGFLCIVMSFLILCVGLPVWAIESEPIKILAIGNSYSNNTTYYISQIAESLGKKVTAVSLYDDGCPIKRHVEWYNTAAKEYQFYVDGVNITGSNKQTMQEVFDLADFDYVTIQQGPGPATDFSTYWTEEEPWLTQLYDIIKKHEPQAEVLIHQTWSFSETDCLNGTRWWSTTYDNSLEMYKLIENAYEQAADKLGIDKETGIIPTGRAIQLAKDEYGYFDGYNQGYATLYPADSSTENAAKHCENGALYTDDINHLNHRSRYIAGCVWLEQILGYDCREATFYPEGVLTAEECVILRNIAHEAVTGEKAYVEGDWRVLPDGDGVELVHFLGTVPKVGTVSVPAEVNGKKVTRVDDTAFKYVDGVKKVILPKDDTIVYEDGALDNVIVLDNVWDGTPARPTKGMGSEELPFLIENGSHLRWAVGNTNKGVYFKLTRDIILNDIEVDVENGVAYTTSSVNEWFSSGKTSGTYFQGIIDGDYHKVYGLYIDEDFNNTEQVWNIGAALIPRAGNGATIKNLGIENSFVKAVGGTAAAFIGTTGSGVYDVSLENCYVGEDVYLYGDDAGAFIGAGNGLGYTNGITDCYSLATVGGTLYYGSITGGVWSGQKCPVTNVYTNNSNFYGHGSQTFNDCFAITEADLGSSTFMTKFAALSDSFTFADGQYPVLKSWAGKSDKIWSGFAVNTLKGDGTEGSPYLISDGEGLAYAILNCGTGKYYKLTNDIYLNDINAVDWETAETKGNYVASSWLEEVTFNGYFDGDGYIVYGIYYPEGNGKESATFRNAALFPMINSNTHIKNVGVRYSHIEIFGHASGIVGFIKRNDTNKNIVIDSCFADNTNYIVHTRQNEATECSSSGILGGTLFTPNIAISNCYSLANLSGPYNNAQIIGSTWQVPDSVKVENCYSIGKLWLNGSAAVSPKTIENCYSTVAPGSYAVWNQISNTDMQGENALTNMPLGDKFVATETYPILKVLKNVVPVPPTEDEEEEEEEIIKILAIGNSYSNNTTYYISRIAESLGKKVTAVSLYDDGCPIDTHVKWYNTKAKEYQFFVDSVNITGNNKQTMQEVFELTDYDYITIQQGPGKAADFSTYWTEETPYLTQLYDIIRENEPQAEIMIHQTWSFSEYDAIGNAPYWHVAYENSLDMFQRIETNYERAADMLGIDKEKGIIPTGRAIQLAKDEYGYWDAFNPGYSSLYYADASIENAAKHCENGALYTDNIDHLNHRGRYIAGCVWLEQILGYDCREATFFPEGVLTEEECVILRAIAHEAVTGEKAYVEGDWRVLPDGEGVEIVHYMGQINNKVGTLTVPSTINGKKVTRVDDTAFKYVEGLKSLILPDDDTIVYEEGALDKYVVLENIWDGTSVKPTKGEGTETSPYLIENGSHLYWAVTNKNVGVYFKLTCDITLNNIIVDTENGVAYTTDDVNEWYTGGGSESGAFAGIIDGDYHTIYGLYIDEDYKNTESSWKLGAGLIAYGGNGVTIKNLAIDNSYIKAVSASASAFIGTTGSYHKIDVAIDSCYIGKDVYIYGGCAGGLIGAGNGTGYVTGISNCYSWATIEASSDFFGAISGQVWSCLDVPATNLYSPNVQLYGQHPMAYVDCYAVSRKETYSKETIVSASQMVGQTAMTKMAGLSDTFTLPSNGYPVLKAWVNKTDDVWSGFAVNTLEGDGTESSPYLISDGEGLAYAIINGGKGKYYKLTNDIYLNDINGVNWETAEAIGNYAPSEWIDGVTFTGYFDGDGHIVYGIYYHAGNGRELTESGYAGLIPCITKNTHVVNVGVRYSHIEIFGRAAGIVGGIVRDSASVNILIDSCFTDETVYVHHTRLYEATGVCSSGILGGTILTPNVKISNCYSLANLSGPYSNNKIVGSTWEVPETFVAENCYGDGALWLCTSKGNAMKTAYNCYSTVAPNATYNTWTQLTKEQMQGENALTNMPLGDKFVVTDGYPMLKVFLKETAEVLLGDVNGDGKVDTTDLAVLKLYLAGVTQTISDGADVDKNGEIDTTDLATLKLYLAGVITKLGAQ